MRTLCPVLFLLAACSSPAASAPSGGHGAAGGAPASSTVTTSAASGADGGASGTGGAGGHGGGLVDLCPPDDAGVCRPDPCGFCGGPGAFEAGVAWVCADAPDAGCHESGDTGRWCCP